MLCRPIRLLSFIALLSSPAFGQAIPSPAQAQRMLQNDPTLITRLQQLMQSSGLTPDQIRARLKAQGYPDSLLDQYLPGGRGAEATGLPGDSVFAAVRALGLADSTSLDSLRGAARGRRTVTTLNDSAFLDTLQRTLRTDPNARNAVRSLLRSRALQRGVVDSGFTVFGLDLFQGDTKLFNANTTGSADANYRFGAGDRLVLFLTGDVERSYALTVTREGFVVIPDVGQISVAGLTRAQLEDALYSRLGHVYSGVRRGAGATTRFYINVAQMGANQVFVNGDVVHPSSYQISRAGTVMSALYEAGGPTPNGSMRNVQIRRNGQTVATLDLYDYALHGDASNDIRLDNGDVVFVPPRGPQVRVAGQVLRPATYEVKDAQSLADVVQMAGGFTETADRRRVQIERIVPVAARTTAGTDRSVVDVPANLLSTAPVLGGDVIRVLEISTRVANRVVVTGNVWTQGPVGLTAGMHLYDALRRAGGLKPDSYLGQVLVSRLRPDSTRDMLRTAVYDTTGRPVNDLALTDGDEITVFSTTTFRPSRYITIAGAVRTAGRIPYRDGMTLRDAVLLADGLQEGALLTDAEIASLPENRAAGATAVTHTVSLDSTYLFERGANERYDGPPGLPAPSSNTPEVTLRPYDNVLIKRQPDWQLQQTVTLLGEVKYPGVYALTRKNERLSDLVARAGGLTTTAYPGGVTFVRARNGIGRIGVDLAGALQDARSADNLALVDGDSVVIPQYTAVVTVRGAVNAPVGVAYQPGANIDYYVRAGGGQSITGDFGRAYVMQPDGKYESRHRRFLWSVSRPVPRPGSTVVVPPKDPNDHRDWLQVASAATSLLGSLVAVVVLVRR